MTGHKSGTPNPNDCSDLVYVAPLGCQDRVSSTSALGHVDQDGQELIHTVEQDRHCHGERPGLGGEYISVSLVLSLVLDCTLSFNKLLKIAHDIRALAKFPLTLSPTELQHAQLVATYSISKSGTPKLDLGSGAKMETSQGLVSFYMRQVSIPSVQTAVEILELAAGMGKGDSEYPNRFPDIPCIAKLIHNVLRH